MISQSILFLTVALHKNNKGGKVKHTYAVPIAAPLIGGHVSKHSPIPFYKNQYSCTNPTTTCPIGYVLQNSVCVGQELHPADAKCLTGYLEDNVCVDKMPSTPTCPPEYTYKFGECVKQMYLPEVLYCPTGYVDEFGVCTQKVPAPVNEICPIGIKKGNVCVVVNSTPALVDTSCPVGFIMEADECCKIETYDCTPAGAHPLECGDNIYSPGCEEYRNLKGYNHGHSAHKLHGYGNLVIKQVIPIITPAVAESVTQDVVINKTCQRKIITDLNIKKFCTFGIMVNDQCQTEEHLPTIAQCTAEGIPENCYNTTTVRHQTKCPIGYQMVARQCAAFENAATIPSCPPGTEQRGDMCYTFSKPNAFCPIGTMTFEGMCSKDIYAPPTTNYCVTCVGSTCQYMACKF